MSLKLGASLDFGVEGNWGRASLGPESGRQSLTILIMLLLSFPSPWQPEVCVCLNGSFENLVDQFSLLLGTERGNYVL